MFDVIFDLIGYIGSVLFVAIVMLYGVSVLFVLFLDNWIERVTEGDKKGFIGSQLPNTYYSRDLVPYIAWLISTVLFVAYTSVINTSTGQDLTWIQGLQNISIKLTPFFSYGVSVVVTLLTINFLAKKGYKLMKAVKTLEDKVK